MDKIDTMTAKQFLLKIRNSTYFYPAIGVILLLCILLVQSIYTQTKTLGLSQELIKIKNEKSAFEKDLSSLRNQDEYKRNEKLQQEITNIEQTYTKTVGLYEQILDLRDQRKDTTELEKELAQSLHLLSMRNYASAEAVLTTLANDVETLIKPTPTPTASNSQPSNAQSSTPSTNNSSLGSGHSRQTIQSDIGAYTLDIVAADLNSTKVIVDTASDSDCRDNCPVLSLADYINRNGAFAGINGSYFCPASYPSCSGKANSFDTLLMNKNKTYLNSDNNVYSNIPIAVFGNGFARFINASSGWGRDTSVDAVIANQPLLLSGGNIVFGGDGDPKKGSKGSRSFIGNKGRTVYIGVVYNVTVSESAHVLKSLGIENALNLDSGGSTALWSGGYKAGPGRDIPNAILFVHR